MSEINDMIQRLCPDGVEYRKLGEVGTFVRGNGLQKNDFVEDGVGCIHYGQIYTYYGTWTYNVKSKVSASLAEKLVKVDSGDLIIACTSENVEDVCKAVAWLGDGQIVTGGHSAVYKHQLEPKYVAYYFQTEDFLSQKKKYARGAKVIDIKIDDLSKIEIPVPPLEVQRKIVEILDNFSELTAELTAELEARRKQYEYYRDNLLNFNRGGQNVSDVKWMKLGDVMTIVRGASPRPIQQYLTSDKNGIHWIKIGDVNPNSKYIEKTDEFITIEGANKSRYLEKGSFVLSNSMSFGRPYILSISGCIHDGWISMVHYEQYFNQDFLYHLLRSDMIQKYWKMKASSGTVSNLNADIVRSTIVPIPSIEQQIEIASVLDKLSSLTTDLTSGLPAEIKARQQQYEYYRDQLLTFKRAN